MGPRGKAGAMDLAGWAVAVLTRLGYAGVALLVALESVFPPVPSEVVLPAAGFAVQRGALSFPLVVAAATAGAVAGALLLYGWGRRLGRERVEAFVDRHGRWLMLERRDVRRADDWFHRHGYAAILLGRLVPGVRSLVSVPAGIARMPLGRFVAYTALGSAAWSAALVGLGVLLGANWHVVRPFVNGAGWVAWGVLALLVAWFVARRRRHAAAA